MRLSVGVDRNGQTSAQLQHSRESATQKKKKRVADKSLRRWMAVIEKNLQRAMWLTNLGKKSDVPDNNAHKKRKKETAMWQTKPVLARIRKEQEKERGGEKKKKRRLVIEAQNQKKFRKRIIQQRKETEESRLRTPPKQSQKSQQQQLDIARILRRKERKKGGKKTTKKRDKIETARERMKPTHQDP